jgi:hypothetical protein
MWYEGAMHFLGDISVSGTIPLTLSSLCMSTSAHPQMYSELLKPKPKLRRLQLQQQLPMPLLLKLPAAMGSSLGSW